VSPLRLMLPPVRSAHKPGTITNDSVPASTSSTRLRGPSKGSRQGSTTRSAWSPRPHLCVNTHKKCAATSSKTFTGLLLPSGPPRILLQQPYSSRPALSPRPPRRRSFSEHPGAPRHGRHPAGGELSVPMAGDASSSPRTHRPPWILTSVGVASTRPPSTGSTPTAVAGAHPLHMEGQTTSGGSGGERELRREYNQRRGGLYDSSED
jgi:hypothetical protein